MTLSLRSPEHIDQLLNYRLLRLYAVSGAPVIRLLEGRYGISRREWRLLALLALHGELSPSGLATLGHLDRPRATRGVQALEAKRLVQRCAEPGHAGRQRLSLTASGRHLYDELFPQIAAINRRVMAVLDEPLTRALDEALTRLTAEAERLNGEVLRELRADRRAGQAQRPRGWAGQDD